jgi:tRNA A37 threonylcarbamoyladenosine synthetase subunit TsaC/SUA5/YrdC
VRCLDIDVGADRLADAILEAFHLGPVIVGLGPVYALAAPPTRIGAGRLDGVKQRGAGKTYSTGLARPEALRSLVPPNALAPALHAALPALSGVILRLPVGDAPDTAAVRGGAHQVLPLPSWLRDTFGRVEAQLPADPALFGDRPYRAALMTSCNWSGHPAGSITDFERAAAFGRARGVPLIVRAPASTESGSFAVVALSGDAWRLCREGPGLPEFLSHLPVGIRQES